MVILLAFAGMVLFFCDQLESGHLFGGAVILFAVIWNTVAVPKEISEKIVR